MRAQTITKTLAAADATAVCASQGLAAAGNLLINGDDATGGVATLDSQRRISILSAGNDSGLTWTVTGANDAGAAISEQVAGGNAVAVSTLQDFKTVRKIASSGAVATTVEVGTSNVGSTPWLSADSWQTAQQIGFTGVVVSGAPTWAIETTQESPWPPLPIYTAGFSQTLPVPTPFPVAGLTNQVGNAQSAVALTGIVAWRLTLSVAAGSVRATAVPAGDWH